MQKSFFIFLILAVAGIFISNELINIGIETEFPVAFEQTTCTDGETLSCKCTSGSQFSKIGSLSIAALGMGFYLAILGVISVARFFPSHLKGLHDTIFLGALASVGYSVFLGIASLVVCQKICPFCAGLYGVNILLLVTAIFSHPDGRWAGLSGIPKVFTTSGFLSTAGLLIITSFIAHSIHEHRWAEAEARSGDAKVDDMDKGAVTSGLTVGETPSRGAEGQADPVVIVEWADFRCGHCGALAKTLKDALRQDPTAFRYHFRHYPLDRTCNPTWSPDVAPGNSCQAAYAMVCADQQGKAWDMHDRIFDNQMGLQNQAEGEAFVMLRAIAQDIGLNMDDFNLCLEKPETKNTVQLDIDDARAVGIQGTPLWFMNGVKQTNDVTARIVLRLAEVARARAKREAAAEKNTPQPTPTGNNPQAPQ